jgi:hypothetical protein
LALTALSLTPCHPPSVSVLSLSPFLVLFLPAAAQVKEETMAQFPSPQHLASWAGLCPGNRESAGKRRSGTTRSGNKWLRRTLCQSAWAVTRKKNCYLSAQFKRLAARRGVKRAVMAVAHSMLIIAYTMLNTGHTYEELGGNYLEQVNKVQLQRYFLKRLRGLGLTVTITSAG